MIAFTFDDCCASVADVAGPIFKRHGMAATFFVCGAYIEGVDGCKCTCKQKCGKPVTVAKLHWLQDNGWEIASHTWTHAKLPNLPADQMAAELRRNIAWLHTNGFRGTGGLSYPWGMYNEASIAVVKQYHRYARATVATKPSEHPERYRLRSIVLSAKVSLGDAMRAIDTGSAIFFGHRIGDERNGYNWSAADLDSLLAHANIHGRTVRPLGEWEL